MRIPPTIKLRIKSLVRPKIEIMNDQRNINIRKLRQMQMLYLTSGAVEGESVYQTIKKDRRHDFTNYDDFRQKRE